MEAAERMLRALRRKEDAARQRLEEIHGYKREYQERMTGAGARGVEIQLLREYHAFLIKIDQAIKHQESEVEKAKENWLAAHKKWMELRRQVQSYEVLEQRHGATERQLDEKRDQRATDETAARRLGPLGETAY